MKEHIKVDNKLNNMGSAVTVSTGDDKLSVVATIAFSKRYLKVGKDDWNLFVVTHQEVPQEAADS